MQAVLLTPDSALLILGFLDASGLVAASRTCMALRPHGDEDGLWRELCEAHGFKQRCATRTRTRGKLPWRTVYVQNLCAECHAPGSVVLNLEARKSRAAELLALCDSCYDAAHEARHDGTALQEEEGGRHGGGVRVRVRVTAADSVTLHDEDAIRKERF